MHHLRVDPAGVSTLEQIPFLPISFFKHHTIKTGIWQTSTTFTSSGTTGADVSRHPVKSLEFYREHARKGFELFFGALSDYNFLALLPSYLERQGSSLIAMIDYFIRQSGSPYSAFYLHDVEKMMADIENLREDPRKTIVWGVSFALL